MTRRIKITLVGVLSFIESIIALACPFDIHILAGSEGQGLIRLKFWKIFQVISIEIGKIFIIDRT